MIVVGISYFGKNSNQPTSQEPIKIGVILPLTGPYGKIGEDAQKAIKLATKGENNIKLVFEDSQFEAKKAVSSYQKLTSIDNIDALINLDSVSFAAINPLISEKKLLTLQIAESSTHDKDTVFQIMPFSYPLFSELGKVSGDKYNKVAIVYGNSDVFIKDADFFKKGISKDKIIYEAMLIPGSDYRTEVTKLLEKKPEATTFFLAVEDGIKFLKVLKDQMGNKRVDLICDGNTELSISQFTNAVGSDIFEGCLSTMLPKQTTENFKNAFKQEYGADAGLFSDYAYDSALIIKSIINQSKSNWVNAIQSLSLNGASGQIEFDINGTRLPAVEVHIFRNGKFEKI